MLKNELGSSSHKYFMGIATVAAALLLFAGGAQANLLTNGDFDADDTSGGDLGCPSGWVCPGGNVFTVNQATSGNPNGVAAADSGSNSILTFGTNVAQQDLVASEGDTWVANGVAQNFSADAFSAGDLLIQILFLEADGITPAGPSGGNFADGLNRFSSNSVDNTSPLDTWVAMGVGTAPAPEGTAIARIVALSLNLVGGAGQFDTFSADFTPIPVPAAVWLFGSALGLLGWMRRKAS